MIGVRAEPYPFGAPEYVELELYLMWRAAGHAGRDAGRAALIVSAPCPECCGTK